MEGLLKHVRKDTKPGASLSDNSYNLSEKVGLTAALSPPDQSRVLITRPPRQMVSLWTCSKMCAIFFVAGIVVGYTLKKRVRRWAAKLLRREHTRVPDTMSTPCFAWLRAWTMEEGRLIPFSLCDDSRGSFFETWIMNMDWKFLSYFVIHLCNFIHDPFKPFKRSRLSSHPVEMSIGSPRCSLLATWCHT